MVLSDGMIHFLKIKKFLANLPKLSCGFKLKDCIHILIKALCETCCVVTLLDHSPVINALRRYYLLIPQCYLPA